MTDELKPEELVRAISTARQERNLLKARITEITTLYDKMDQEAKSLETQRNERIVSEMVAARRKDDKTVTLSSLGRKYGVTHQWVSELMKRHYSKEVA